MLHRNFFKELQAELRGEGDSPIPPIFPKNTDKNLHANEVMDLIYHKIHASCAHTVVLLCADHAGFGDLLFGMRTAQLLKQHFHHAKIILVSTVTGKKKILHLEGDKDLLMDIPLLNVEEYKTLIAKNAIKADLLIEAPVFSILRAEKNAIYRGEQVLLISEYGANQYHSPTTISASQQKEEMDFIPESKISVINTGFHHNESGILIDPYLSQDMAKHCVLDSIHERYKKIILQDQAPEDYFNSFELALSYKSQFTEEDLCIYAELFKHSNKNADIVVLGNHSDKCKSLSDLCITVLKENGFDALALHDLHSDHRSHQSLNTQTNTSPKTFRIIHGQSIPHHELRKLQKIAGKFRSTTGDQTQTEAYSIEDVTTIHYEALAHKTSFIQGMRALAKKHESHTTGISRVYQLLTYGATKEEIKPIPYSLIKELGELIRNPQIQDALKRIHHEIRNHYNLNVSIVARVNRLLLHTEHENFAAYEGHFLQAVCAKNIEQIKSLEQRLLADTKFRKYFYENTHKALQCGSLHEAIATNNYKQVLFHIFTLSNGSPQIEVNMMENGITPLSHALMQSNPSLPIIQCLIDCGANVNALNADGTLPLAISMKAGHDTMSKLLKDHGAISHLETASACNDESQPVTEETNKLAKSVIQESSSTVPETAAMKLTCNQIHRSSMQMRYYGKLGIFYNQSTVNAAHEKYKPNAHLQKIIRNG